MRELEALARGDAAEADRWRSERWRLAGMLLEAGKALVTPQ